jgi:glycosyltransferase involved in cell wall biosynthesis
MNSYYNELVKLESLPENPLISIIVPSYNQGKYIRATLDSVLAQDYRPIEILVIDGASTDGTIDILHQYDNVPEVNWVSEPDRGIVEATNKGFARAKGEICAIQSSDDYYLPGALSTIVRYFKNDPKLGLVYGDVVKIDTSGNELWRNKISPFSLEGFLARETYIPQPAAFFRLELVQQLGGWDERIPYVPDTDLWLRIAFHSNVKKIDEFLACFRSHPEQRDKYTKNIYRDYTLMITQSKDIAAAPRKLRKAAKAGLYLLGLRYNVHKSDWELTKALWKAVIYYPRCIFFKTFPKHRLVPGYFRLAHGIGVIRRLLKRVIGSN